jgi:hypothetical protein
VAGRLSRRRLHAVPRHQGNRARRRQPRSVDRMGSEDQGRVEELRHRRRPRLHGDVRRARRRSSISGRIRRSATTSS